MKERESIRPIVFFFAEPIGPEANRILHQSEHLASEPETEFKDQDGPHKVLQLNGKQSAQALAMSRRELGLTCRFWRRRGNEGRFICFRPKPLNLDDGFGEPESHFSD